MRVSGQGAPTINQHGNVGNAQAINADYNQVNNPNGYQKGHLFPRNHCSNQIEADSTHTLTNAAPQAGQDNRVWYRQVEKEIACSIRARCTINPPLIIPYVVTGVIPSNNVPPLNGRVNVPTHYWSAFCCRDRMNQNNFISEGYVMVMNGLGTGQLTTYGTAQGAQNQFNQLNVFLGFNVFGQQPGCS